MQAVIMAAGKSTRTHPLTATRPKPLVPIWDRPLLEHQLRQLDGLVDEVLLVVGFLRERIEGRFGDSFGGIRLRYVVQELQRGTADALLAARPHVNSRCLVLNGDDFYHKDDLRGLAERGCGLLVTQAKDPENRAVVRMDGDVITGIVEKPKDPPKDAWCSVGGYSVEKDDLRYLDDIVPSPRGELELPDFILRLIAESVVRAKRIERFWLPITYSWDVLQAALFLWEDPARARELGLVAETMEAIRRRPDVTLGRDIAIEGPVRLGANVHIEDGVLLIGFRYENDAYNGVVSIRLRPVVPEDNRLFIEVESVRAGLLPISVKGVLDNLTRRLNRAGWPVEWTETNGNDVAIVSLDQAREHRAILESVEIDAEALRISGRRAAQTPGVPRTAYLHTRRVRTGRSGASIQ